MRLHVLSDLHLEQDPFSVPEVDADAIILAGDVHGGTLGIEWARQWGRGRPVLYVAGNHEFYGFAWPRLIDELRAASAGSPLTVLENDAAVIDGVRFLGCTLWTDFDFDGSERRAESMMICQRVVNDYKRIEVEPGGRRLSPEDTRSSHLASRRWLEERLAEPYDGTTVVVTHHAPLIRTKPDSAIWRAVAGAFASDLTALMGGERVALWIFGHTHRTADLEVRGTRVISNPRGYPHEPVDGFDPERVIDVPS